MLTLEECNTKSWDRFRRSISKFWRKDYFRKPRPSAGLFRYFWTTVLIIECVFLDISLSIEKRVLHYNFDRIDTNHDDHISHAEWKFYRTSQRHPIKGRCSRDIFLHCDHNLNRLLDRNEWMQCLYILHFNNQKWYHPKDTLGLSFLFILFRFFWTSCTFKCDI